MVFPVVMYGCESWSIKKVVRQRIDTFELWCWRRLLRVPWTARRSNQPILKEISSEYSLEGLMLKLKLHYLATWRKELSLEKSWMLGRLKAGKGDNRGWDDWRASPTQWTWVWVNSGSWWWIGRPGMLKSMGSQRVRHDWATELNWTELTQWTWVSATVGDSEALLAAVHGVAAWLSDWTTTTIRYYYFHPFKFHNNGNWLKLTHIRRVDEINFENFSLITNHYMCLVLTSCLSYYLFHEIYKATSKISH